MLSPAQPGHQPVCQRHNRAMKDLGLASAFFRLIQVSQANVFLGEGVFFVFMRHFFQEKKHSLSSQQ
jgi:hypothetical protein